MAGLGCARQLHNLFKQYGNLLAELGLDEPNIVVLEGRSRIGGRVYSRPLQVQPRHRHPEFRQSRCIAEMGGMIVTGFDRGNPMNVLIRGQLGLHYHSLLSATTIYDIDGKPADATRDRMVEDLFNECLDRVSKYKFKIPSQTVVEGNRDYINQGRDCHSEGHKTIARAEEGATTQARLGGVFKDTKAKGWQLPERSQSAPASTSSLQAQEATLEDCEMLGTEKHALARSLPPTTEMSATNVTNAAGLRLKRFGWKLKPGVEEKRDIDLDPAASVPGATLGSVIEDAIKQFGELVEMSAQDLRLLNWHIANLEYSNATNHSRLSLLGWDIDAGNEWEGKHSMIIGGYQSVPRGLMLCPTPLHVRKQKVVKKINYVGPDDASRPNLCESHKSPVVIELEDGATFDADYIVNTIPLGVLKHGDVQFDPPLPQWKEGPITRLGYGVLNKIVLTYRQPFWDTERDIFGVLREPSKRFSLDQRQYSKRRGRMFQWFNVTKTAGVPCLIALMAGDAAVDAEKTSNDKLIAEAAAVLRSVFGAHNVPEPIEAVLTRWSSDRFSRGSYSSAGPAMQLDDYDAMARPVGKHLHFAGEHTIGTHPATVHGAYLSGLRAASDVFEEIVGPIKFSMPLVQSKDSLMTTMKRKLTPDEDGGKASDDSSGSRNSRSGRSAEPDANSGSRRCLEVRDLRTQELISKQVGDRPSPPSRPDDDPYQLFSKANYERASNNCVQSHRPGQGHPTPDKVRALLSKMWRSAGAEERLPYAEAAAAKRREYDAALTLFNAKIAEWDRRSTEVRRNYERAHAENGSQDVETIRQTELPATSELCRPELDNIETQDESCHMP
ncbi:hypothetical protein SEPCBS119000_006621 [Sporothrix epigloea]|uniref:HMG box domain-containing protein n=1 Tax=Sporothrix epigloea TaxID=1892477 RepID=A0ABP0E772_9PEZI